MTAMCRVSWSLPWTCLRRRNTTKQHLIWIAQQQQQQQQHNNNYRITARSLSSNNNSSNRIRQEHCNDTTATTTTTSTRTASTTTTTSTIVDSSLWRLGELSRPEWRLIGQSAATLGVTSSVMLLLPYASGYVIDATIATADGTAASSASGSPMVMAGGLFGLMCLSGGGMYLRSLWLTKAGNRIVARLRQQAYQQLLLQEHAFHSSQRGDWLSRLSSDAQLIQAAVTTHAVAALRAIVISTGSASMLIYTSPTLAALSLSTLPPIFIFARSVGRDLKAQQKEVQTTLGQATSLAEQALTKITTVKQYGAEYYESHQYYKATAKAHRLALQTAHSQAQLEAITHIGANGAILAVLGYGANLVLAAQITAGDLTGFVLYSFLLAGNVSSLTNVYADIVRAIAASERVTDILHRQPLIPPPPPTSHNNIIITSNYYDPLHPIPHPYYDTIDSNTQTTSTSTSTSTTHLASNLTTNKNSYITDNISVELKIENLTFSYPIKSNTHNNNHRSSNSSNNIPMEEETNANVLKHFNLTITPGQVLALVGRNGSGKSTLTTLLTRIYDVPANTIFINNTCIHQIPIHVLRQQYIGVVSQQPEMFHGSIRDNILYGSWDKKTTTTTATTATFMEDNDEDNKKEHDKLWKAVKSAHVWDFVKHFKHGLDTDATTLSGGQKQRVAIARVLYKDPPFIILDEATASLDTASEHLVQQAMNEIYSCHQNKNNNKTILSIAHRLSTIRQANTIAVLDNGQIVQQGTFQQLSMDSNGTFYDIMKTKLNQQL